MIAAFVGIAAAKPKPAPVSDTVSTLEAQYWTALALGPGYTPLPVVTVEKRLGQLEAMMRRRERDVFDFEEIGKGSGIPEGQYARNEMNSSATGASMTEQVLELLMSMEDQEREICFGELRDRFCIACGAIQPPPPLRRCQCWNDE